MTIELDKIALLPDKLATLTWDFVRPKVRGRHVGDYM
jgi:hypothetical protein